MSLIELYEFNIEDPLILDLLEVYDIIIESESNQDLSAKNLDLMTLEYFME